MTPQLTPVILVVDNHWLLGKVSTGGHRVLDILTQAGTDYLKLVDVKLFRSAERRRCVGELAEAVVPKDRMSLLLIPTEKFEVPRTKRIHAIVEKKTSWAYLVAAGITVEGQIHLTKRINDSLYTLTNTLGHFFPVTDATVSVAVAEPMAVKVAIVNKTFVSCFSSGSVDVPTAVSSAAREAALSADENHANESTARSN